jgi:hypothetical protein
LCFSQYIWNPLILSFRGRDVELRYISGWNRYSIILAIIGFILGPGIAIDRISKDKLKLKEKRFAETIELALPQIKKECVKDAIDDLKKSLSGNTSDFLNNEFLEATHGIRVSSSEGNLTIAMDLENIQPNIHPGAAVKSLTFDIKANPAMVIDEVEKSYRELFESKSASFVRFHRYGAKNDEAIINEIHDKYENLYDFSGIERDYRTLNIEAYILNIFLGFGLGVGWVAIFYGFFWFWDLYCAAKSNQHMVTGGLIARN